MPATTDSAAPADASAAGDEARWVRDARAGDRAAFERLFDRFLPRVRLMAAFGLGARMRSRIEVDDAVQEVFAEAWRAIGSFDPDRDGSFLGWLREIARHRFLALADRELGREKRDPRRESRLPEDTAAAAQLPPATVTSPTGACLRAEAIDTLQRALSRLSDDHRRVILLRCIEERPAAEVAREMGRTENAASVLLFRALARLREAFAVEGGA